MTATRNIENLYRLSPLQEGILYHALEHTDPGVYVGQYTCTLHGELCAERLHRVWVDLVRLHPALRTLFVWRGQETPVQLVRGHVELPWTTADWRTLAADLQTQRWQAFAEAQRAQGFALDKAPLLRVALVRTGPTTYLFSLCYHHIVLDGWSLRLLLDEALTLYQAQDGATGERPVDGSSYAEFIDWIQGRDWSDADTFWQRTLATFDTPTRLPLMTISAAAVHPGTAAPTPSPPSSRTPSPKPSHSSLEKSLDEKVVAQITAFARARRITVNSLLVGAWAVLLSRYTDKSDVLFGTTWAGRSGTLPDCHHTVGLFINTLPTGVRVGNEQVGAWLENLHSMLVEMREYEQTPLLRAQSAMQLPAGESPFDSLVVIQSVPQEGPGAAPWQVADENYFEYSNYPLALLVRPGDPFRLVLVYDRRRYVEADVARLLQHFLNVLHALVAEPNGRLDAIEVIDDQEHGQLLDGACGPVVAFDQTATIDTQIKQAAASHQQTVALLQEDRSVTYQELCLRADQLTQQLHAVSGRDGKASPGAFYGAVFLERSPEAFITMLALQSAGGTYVPMDPQYPAARTRQILEDLEKAALMADGTAVVLTGRALRNRLPATAVPVICVDEALGDDIQTAVTQAPGRTHGADDLAYLMYTSGSSGRPKGTLVTHKNIVASTAARMAYYPQPPRRFLLLSSLATDSSVAGIFWTLCTGGTLVLPRPRQEQSIAGLAALIQDTAITHMLCLASVHRLLLEYADITQLASLECVIVAGEACPAELVTTHFARLPAVSLFNEYGPSEATVWATVAQLTPDTQDVPIGTPIANAAVYVLDHGQRLMPVGLPGELYIGGAGVTRGYLGNRNLSNQKFVASPFSDAHALLYRTGDRACWHRDGQLRFLGRVDEQIKVRGFRVEPEEIEQLLLDVAGITAATVVLTGAATGVPRLTAFITCAGSPPDPQDLRDQLQHLLPDFMLPQAFVTRDEMPLTPGGKVDRAALRALEVTAKTGGSTTASHVAPRTAEEKLLAQIWTAVLAIDEPGIHDNFFALGGDSLLSIRVLARAHKAGLEISPTNFFAAPTIAGQALAAQAIAGQAIAGHAITGKAQLTAAVETDVKRPAADARPSPRPFALSKLDAAGLAAVTRQLANKNKKS